MARNYRESSDGYRRSTPTVRDTLRELSDIALELMIDGKWNHVCAQYTGYNDICTICFLRNKRSA